MLTIAIFAGVKYLYRVYFVSFFNFPPYTKINIRKFIADGIIWYVHFFIWALGYYFALRFSDRQKQFLLEKQEKDRLVIQKIELQSRNLKLQTENLELQNEKLKTEYNFLKAQINPHFLYNTLSFFYSKVAVSDKKTADGIALLTDIMRYSLQSGGPDGKVELQDEMLNLDNYIRLQQLRFNNTLNIKLVKNIEDTRYRVLPHIFITLVENAFKHGEVNNPLQPLEISLEEKEGNMVFSVKNKIQENPALNSGTGVGLENTRNRIKMEYGDAGRLESFADEDMFTVIFSVPLILLEKKISSLPPVLETPLVPLTSKKIAL